MISQPWAEQLRQRRARIAEHVRLHDDLGLAAREFGVSVATVLNAVREHGVPYQRRRSGNIMGTGSFDILWQLLYTNLAPAEIAKQLGVSLQSIHRIETLARERRFPLPDRFRQST
jgi:transposase